MARSATSSRSKSTRSETDSFGPIDVVPTDNASLGKGKYAADDGIALVEWDSTLNNGKGSWMYITEVGDITTLG